MSDKDLFGNPINVKRPRIFDDAGKLIAGIYVDPGPLAKRSDPFTSKLSGSKMRASFTRITLMKEVLKLVAEHPGWTSRQFSDLRGDRDLRTVGRRLSDLKKSGLVRNGSSVKDSVTGEEALTWWVTMSVMEPK